MEIEIYCTRCERSTKMLVDSKLAESLGDFRQSIPSFVPSQDPIVVAKAHCPICRIAQFRLMSIWEREADLLLKNSSVPFEGFIVGARR